MSDSQVILLVLLALAAFLLAPLLLGLGAAIAGGAF